MSLQNITTTNKRYPAEWEKQQTTWFSWPHNINEWGEKRLQEIKKVYIELISTILDFQNVNLILANEELLAETENLFSDKKFSCKRIVIPNNDVWIRDYGPFFLEKIEGNKRKPLILDFNFNGWGEKFPPWDLDNEVPKKIASHLNIEVESPHMILEGGAIEFSGNGLILTTEQCLLNKKRNPNLNKEEIETSLKSAFCAEEVIWLKYGLKEDHTDGHIDNVARFIDPIKVLVCRSYDTSEADFKNLAENANYLKNWKHPTKGYSLEVIELPMPEWSDHRINKLPYSYANFIFVNNGVIVPTFNCKSDDLALKIFKLLFPDKEVIGIDCTLLIQEGGGLHCITKQEPFIY